VLDTDDTPVLLFAEFTDGLTIPSDDLFHSPHYLHSANGWWIMQVTQCLSNSRCISCHKKYGSGNFTILQVSMSFVCYCMC